MVVLLLSALGRRLRRSTRKQWFTPALLCVHLSASWESLVLSDRRDSLRLLYLLCPLRDRSATCASSNRRNKLETGVWQPLAALTPRLSPLPRNMATHSVMNRYS